MSTFSDKFFADKAVGALWDVAVSIKRGNPLPLDKDSVVHGIDELNAVAAGAVSYPGQIIAVIEDAVYEGEGEEAVLVKEESTTLYYLDHNKEPKEVGKVPVGDNLSIDVVNEKISLHDFGKAYYKYIAEVKDEQGNVTSPAHYDKVEVGEGVLWKSGLEARVVKEGEEYVLGWFEPNPTTIEGINNQVTDAQKDIENLESAIGQESQYDEDGNLIAEATGIYKDIEDIEDKIGDPANSELNQEASGLYALLDQKANAADVYTIEEANAAISTAVADANHLKRIILEQYEDIQGYIDDAEFDESQYIFMVPTTNRYSNESNKYDEYIVIDKVIEPVGSWAVDLSDYVSETELTTYLADYYTETQINEILNAYAKSSEFSNYYKMDQIDDLLDKYYTSEELDVLLQSYYTSSAADDKFVAKEEGKSLVSDTEIAKLATVEENAEENYIKSTTSQFAVSEEGELSLNDIAISKVTGLQENLDAKADKVYYTVTEEDEEGNPVEKQVEGAFLSPTDKEKLAALVIGDNGVQVSGKVNADNVQGLSDWITNNRETVPGLLSSVQSQKLANIEDGAEKNYISSVSESFQVIEGKLLFAEETITTLNQVSTNTSAIQAINNILEDTVEIDPETGEETVTNLGLRSVVSGMNTRLFNLENSFSDLETLVNKHDQLLTWNAITLGNN